MKLLIQQTQADRSLPWGGAKFTAPVDIRVATNHVMTISFVFLFFKDNFDVTSVDVTRQSRSHFHFLSTHSPRCVLHVSTAGFPTSMF